MRLIYCAVPSRMYEKSTLVMDYVDSKGCAPFNPLLAFPLERFEFGSVGREETMNYCRRLIDLCDEFWIFGLSKGTIEEISYAIKIRKPVKIVKEFDDEWEKKKIYFSDEIKFLSGMKQL